MIISKSPYRVSFFGGGTDYPVWYRENGGSVLVSTINKYCYISCRYLPPFFEHKFRIVWSQVELTSSVEEIRHPSVRECLKFMNITEGVEIHHAGDLPARAGMGTSSAFTVGLLNALYALKGIKPPRMTLAINSIHVERDRIGENVGSQDQTAIAFGGINQIHFGPGDNIIVSPVVLSIERLHELQSHLLLLYTGVSRTASHIAGELIDLVPYRKEELKKMQAMVSEAISILTGPTDIVEFGRLLHESWMLKRSLAPKTSLLFTDFVYESALKAGAMGGKVLGAGGGGFILLFAEPDIHSNIVKSLRLLQVPFTFETEGSRIIYYD